MPRVRVAFPSSRNALGSYYQLAIVVPLVALALLAGGVGAIINGFTVGGVGAALVGALLALGVVWFVRLPVRDSDQP